MAGKKEEPKKTKAEKSIDERAHEWIAQAQENYSIAITEAREASETTVTPAWSDNYRAQRAFHDKIIRDLSASIENGAKRIADFDSTEDDEKEIRDAVKAMQEERIRYSAWKSRAVAPYQSKAERCIELLESVQRNARNVQEAEPLIWFGVVDVVGKIIAKWPTAHWDSKDGIVTVKEPPAEASQVVNA